MAATIVNGPGVPALTRGRNAINLGSIAANNNAVAFTVPQLIASPNGNDYLIITMGGTAIVGLVAVLEGSIDAGVTWFSIPPVTGTIVVTGTIDTAAQFAAAYLLLGSNGITYRFGATTFTSGGPGTVWAYIA